MASLKNYAKCPGIHDYPAMVIGHLLDMGVLLKALGTLERRPYRSRRHQIM
jgi:hypothetical protein